MPDLWLSLGSNLGERKQTLRAALGALPEFGIAPLAVSSLYATAPQGVTDQPEFLNCAAHCATRLAPLAALSACAALEQRYGRERAVPWGPRTLDIDVLFYDNLTLSEAALTLPHPRIWERAFVLAPLLELWPDLRAPGGMRARVLLDQLRQNQPVRRLAGAEWATGRDGDER